MPRIIDTPRHPASKNDEYQALDLRAKIAKHYLSGKSQAEIGVLIGCSTANISYHLKRIREEWLKRIVQDYNTAKAIEVAKIDRMEELAWASFAKSCEDNIVRQRETERGIRVVKNEDGTTTTELAPSPTSVTSKKISKGQAGDPRFLERIAWCIDYRCKLFGILKEQPTTVNQLILNFDQLYGKPDFTDDPIERRIQAVQLADGSTDPTSPQNEEGTSDDSGSEEG